MASPLLSPVRTIHQCRQMLGKSQRISVIINRGRICRINYECSWEPTAANLENATVAHANLVDASLRGRDDQLQWHACRRQ